MLLSCCVGRDDGSYSCCYYCSGACNHQRLVVEVGVPAFGIWKTRQIRCGVGSHLDGTHYKCTINTFILPQPNRQPQPHPAQLQPGQGALMRVVGAPVPPHHINLRPNYLPVVVRTTAAAAAAQSTQPVAGHLWPVSDYYNDNSHNDDNGKMAAGLVEHAGTAQWRRIIVVVVVFFLGGFGLVHHHAAKKEITTPEQQGGEDNDGVVRRRRRQRTTTTTGVRRTAASAQPPPPQEEEGVRSWWTPLVLVQVSLVLEQPSLLLVWAVPSSAPPRLVRTATALSAAGTGTWHLVGTSPWFGEKVNCRYRSAVAAAGTGTAPAVAASGTSTCVRFSVFHVALLSDVPRPLSHLPRPPWYGIDVVVSSCGRAVHFLKKKMCSEMHDEIAVMRGYFACRDPEDLQEPHTITCLSPKSSELKSKLYTYLVSPKMKPYSTSPKMYKEATRDYEIVSMHYKVEHDRVKQQQQSERDSEDYFSAASGLCPS